MRVISLMWSISPRNGFRALPILPPSDLLGIYLTSAGSAGLCLQSFKILGYGRPHPAHRAPGNEDRLSLHLARFVGISESQLAHLSEGHPLPTFSARSAKYEVLSDPSLRYPFFFHAKYQNTGANHPRLGVGRHAAVFNHAATPHSAKPTALRDEAVPENIRSSIPWRLRGHRSIERSHFR